MSLWKLGVVGCAAFGALLLLVNSSSGLSLVAAFLMVAAAVWYAERTTLTHILPFDRAVLITGCDTGFGFELAHHLDSMGISVFAGCLFKDGEGAKKLQTNCSERMHVLQMDVTNDQQVASAVTYMEQHLPSKGLLGIVNNAGLNHIGDIECTPMEHFEKVTQINTLGTIRVTKACLPLLRKWKGRIVNVTSVQGILPIPYLAPYNLTKHAGEAFADMLRMEMRKWGVQVVIIEPGHFGGATGCIEMNRLTRDFNEMWEKSSEDVRQSYGREYIIDGHLAMSQGGKASSNYNIFPVIEAMTEALLAIKPKYRYAIGGSQLLFDPYLLLGRLHPFIPTCIMDRVMIRFAGQLPLQPKALLGDA